VNTAHFSSVVRGDPLWRTLGLPLFIGFLIAAALTAELFWARGLSLRWAAPMLRGEAPPVLMLLLVPLLGLAVLSVSWMRGWWPTRANAPIALLLIATQCVGFSLANIEPLKICLLIVCAGWLADALMNNRPVRLYPPFLMAWLVMLAFAFASVVNGLVSSLVAQYTIAAKFLMFFIVPNLIRSPTTLLFALRLVVGLGIASSVLALMQEALFYFFNLPLSLDDNATKYWFKDTPLGWMIRATAFHPTAQNLSHWLLMAFAILLLGPFTLMHRLVGGALMVLGIFFTFTGNGLVVMALICFAAPIVHKPRFLIHYLAILSLVGLVTYQLGVMEWVYEKYLLPISGKSAEDRIGLLQMGLEVIERHPVVGMGLNNFGRVSPQPVHNAYMQMVTEIGVVPGVVLCLIFLFIVARLLIGVAHTRPGPLQQAGKGVLLAFLALLVHFMFEPFINSLVSWCVIGLAEATALLLYMRFAKDQPVNHPPYLSAAALRTAP
jgi:hypothetical protein